MKKHPLSAFDEGRSYTSPEHRLAMAVIINAISEAMGHSSLNESNAARERCQSAALRWFTEAGTDFRAVCDLADLHPEAVRNAALAYIERGERLPRRVGNNGKPQIPTRNCLSVPRIAQHAGVSASSVRNVMNGTASASMRSRVQSAINATEASQ